MTTIDPNARRFQVSKALPINAPRNQKFIHVRYRMLLELIRRRGSAIVRRQLEAAKIAAAERKARDRDGSRVTERPLFYAGGVAGQGQGWGFETVAEQCDRYERWSALASELNCDVGITADLDSTTNRGLVTANKRLATSKAA